MVDRGTLIHASLLAGAMGDSLGAEVEFASLDEIRRAYPHGIIDLPPHDGIVGAITDDTQMTLFTAEGLIRAAVRAKARGICHVPSVVHHALLRWYRTQGSTPAMKIDDRGLVADPRLRVQRAPGNTCLSSLGQARRFGDIVPNDSKGCGTIMRVAPVAFTFPNDRGTVFDVAMETSALTHGHPTGQIAAAAWALMLHDVENGAALEDSARAVARQCRELQDGGETAAAIDEALGAPRDGRAETVERIGAGWVAEEALAIALHCSLGASDLETGLRMAVTHGGDSDSTGAIAGNMLGLLYPQQVFSHRWTGQVECADLIARLAADLSQIRDPGIKDLDSRYPGW